MPLGTLDRNPPPFFHQGPSALSRLLLAAALAIFLMAADHRFALIQPLRNALATGLPVRVLGLPVALVGGSADYLGGLDQAWPATRRCSAS
jgi:rod shape-determining protein MreC